MTFIEQLQQRPLLADGAMGTMIYSRGVDLDQSFDELNLIEPNIVLDIHRAYVEAGADILETNTFSATPIHLQKWNVEKKAVDINAAGVRIAKQAASESRRKVFVAGSVGPTGARLAPIGSLKPSEAYEAFKLQMSALANAGADLLVLETFSDLIEIEQAIRAAREVCDLPIVAEMTFSREVRTIVGITPEQAAKRLSELGANVIGANCSTGPRGVIEAVQRIKSALSEAHLETPISAMPNAGFPEHRGARLFYPATPEYFANYAKRFLESGARIIGGCCGTLPEHIAAMRDVVDGNWGASHQHSVKQTRQDEEDLRVTSYQQPPTKLSQALSENKFVITVEVEPPRSADTSQLERNAKMLKEAGATVLDISDIPMARMRMTGLAAATRVQQATHLETVLHFPVRGRNLLRVQGDLLAAHAMNVRNLFVTMGDPAAIGDFPQAFDHHDVVPTGLTQMVKNQFNAGKDGAGGSIGQPCSFVVGVALNLTPTDFDKEAKLLKKKIDCGADFALTQPVFDPKLAAQFLSHYDSQYGKLALPVLVGILPLATSRHALFLKNEVPGMFLPDKLIERMERAGEHCRDEGMAIALEALNEIRPQVQGVYFIPAFRRYDIVAKLIEDIKPLL